MNRFIYFLASILFSTILVTGQTTKAPDSLKGKIVFSSRLIEKTIPDQEALKKDFGFMDEIYGQIYLEKPLSGYYQEMDMQSIRNFSKKS